MTPLSQINLHLEGSVLLLIVCAALGVAISYYVYRQTIPPVPTFWRVMLSIFRSLVIFFIILMLFEPVLSLKRRKQLKPVVAVLLDTSASMALVDQKTDRRSELQQLLKSGLLNPSTDDYTMQYYNFSDRLQKPSSVVPDTLLLEGDGTDIKSALQNLKDTLAESYLAAAILITDGADNLGSNPARYASTYGIPVYTIAIGDPSEQTDVLISNYMTNEVAYADACVPVEVYIKSSGFAGKKIAVTLTKDGEVIDGSSITLSGNAFEQKTRLHFTPENDGLQKYELRIANLEGELTRENNTKSFYIKVLKSRQKVLLISGGPGADHVFLKRALDKDENIELSAFIEKGNGRFYRPFPTDSQLPDFDLIILAGYPRKSSSNQMIQRLRGILAKGKPVLVFYDNSVDFLKLSRLTDFTPLRGQPVRGPEQTVYLDMQHAGFHHPVLRLSENDSDNRTLWRDLPPVFTDIRTLVLQSSAQVLAGVDTKKTASALANNTPLVVVSKAGNRKSAIVLASGLWRWDLLMWGIGRDNSSYQKFVRNTIRWLTSEEDSKHVRIVSNKEIYRSGEEVIFQAQVYYEDFEPVDGAEVAVQLSGNNTKHALSLTGIGDGRYEGRFQVLAGGDFTFDGTAHQQGRVLGRDSGKFSVEPFSLEFQNTRMNEDLLRKIASESNGAYFTPDDFSALTDHLSFPEKFISLESEWQLLNQWWIVVACILLLSLEWFIRKRKGML